MDDQPTDPLVAAVVAAVMANPPAVTYADETGVWPPRGAHGRVPGHRYDGRCAICRAGDQPEALRALVADVVRLTIEATAPPWYHRVVAMVVDERDRERRHVRDLERLLGDLMDPPRRIEDAPTGGRL